MMLNFAIQKEYVGVEASSIALACMDIEDWHWRKLSNANLLIEDRDVCFEVPVGSVEFCEQALGYTPYPLYYPLFLREYLRREVYLVQDFKKFRKSCFIKPADKHKRFDAFSLFMGRGFDPFVEPKQALSNPEVFKGPYWCSELMTFVEEWRYYVADGEVLTAVWYQGRELEIKAPELDIDWPEGFCGAVDFGRAENGDIVLIENNLPYGCGWYGSVSEGEIFGKWLNCGWNFMRNYLTSFDFVL